MRVTECANGVIIIVIGVSHDRTYCTNIIIWLSLRCCHLFEGSFILHGSHQFLAYSVVNLHELGYTAVKTYCLSFSQLSLVVFRRNAFLVT